MRRGGPWWHAALDRTVDDCPAAGAGAAAAAGGGPRLPAGAHGAARGARLPRAADCPDLRLWRGRGAAVAAPLSRAGRSRAGGPAPVWPPAQGPPGGPDCGHPGEPAAHLLGPRADLLDGGPADHLPDHALPAGAVG